MQQKILKSLIIAISVSALLFFGARGWFRATDDFRLSNITYNLPAAFADLQPRYSQDELDTVDALLSQPFDYVGKGAQSYAFSSRDGKYIIKFFKFKHLKVNFFDRALGREEGILRKERLVRSIFEGHALAWQRHREETGLLFVQLVPNGPLKKEIEVFDKLKISRKIPLSEVVFVVQKKAVPSREALTALLEVGNMEELKHHIQMIFKLYGSTYSKGLYDRDHGVLHNTGFVEGSAIHFDVGKLTDEPRMVDRAYAQGDFDKIVQKFRTWFRYHWPNVADEMTPFLDDAKFSFAVPSINDKNDKTI